MLYVLVTDLMIVICLLEVALKTGDLIFTGTPAGVGPVKIGDHLQGYFGKEKVLDFRVR